MTDYKVKRVIKLDAQNQGQDSTETYRWVNQ